MKYIYSGLGARQNLETTFYSNDDKWDTPKFNPKLSKRALIHTNYELIFTWNKVSCNW